MIQPKAYWVGFHPRGDFIHKALVREGVLQAPRRAKRSCEERRVYFVGENSLAADLACAAALSADTTGEIRRNHIAPIVQLFFWLGGRFGRVCFRIVPDERSSDHVPRLIISRSGTAGG